jgi:hypothetical protein
MPFPMLTVREVKGYFIELPDNLFQRRSIQLAIAPCGLGSSPAIFGGETEE